MVRFWQICESMKYKALYVLIVLLCTEVDSAKAQNRVADSLWCDHLYNIIRCVSMAQIYEPVGPPSKDTFDIPAFSPQVHLAATDRETMQRRYKKITYLADLLSTTGSSHHATLSMDQWAARFVRCLEGWDTARIANRDSTVEIKDYFITNGEDETTVRLSIIKASALGDSYQVRITIY